MNVKKKFLVLLGIILIGLFAVRMVGAADKAASDTGYLGADQWIVQSDGDILPITDSSFDIGETDSEVDNIYTDGLILGGVEKNSWGSIVSPMTDAGAYVHPTDAEDHLKLFNDGDITLGGAHETDVQITWDGNGGDYYCGLYDGDDELQIGIGAALDTTNMLTFTTGYLMRLFDGSTNDMTLVFDGGGYDFHIGIDDASGEEEDLFVMGRGAAAGTNSDIAIGKSSGMVYMEAITSKGSADFDIGEAGVTDVTVTTDGGAIILDGLITLPNGEIVNNTGDDVIQIASDDAAADLTLSVYAGFNGKDALLMLSSDISTDDGDDWQVKNDDGDSNNLLFQNDTTGSQATKLTLGKTGVITSTNVANLVRDDTASGEVDALVLIHSASDNTSADNDAVSISVHLETDANAVEEFAEIDFVATDVSNGSEDVDITFSQYSAGTLQETLDLVAASSATVSDYLQYTAHTTEDNLVVDVMKIRLDDTGDTRTDNFGLGISIELDDETTGVEQQASIDFVLTDAGSTAEDCDILFSQNIAGDIAASLRLDADAGLDLQVAGWDIILPDDETIANASDVVTIASDDNITTLTLLGFTDKAARLILDADLSTDTTDTWIIEAEDGSDLTITNGTTEIVEFSSAGALQIDDDLSVDGGDLDTSATYLKILSASTAFHKYHYYPIAYVGTTQARVGGGAEALLCAGLASGADEIGTTQGYVLMDEEADYLRFRFALPETFIDTGVATDLVIEFYMDEQATNDAVTYDVAIYEFGATTAIITDTITIAHDASAGWKGLASASTGIGDVSEIDADDILVITLTPQAPGPYDWQATKVYGCRIKYATGIEATE